MFYQRLISHFSRSFQTFYKRGVSNIVSDPNLKGLVLGVYDDGKYSATAQKFSSKMGGKLEAVFRHGGRYPKCHTEVLNFIDPEFNEIVIVGVGPEKADYNSLENLDEGRENVRIAAAIGARKLRQSGIGQIFLDDMGNAECVGEGVGLALWNYQQDEIPALQLYKGSEDDEEDDKAAEKFNYGLMKAQAQNIARYLSDTPSNLMTPFAFTQSAAEILCKCGVTVTVREKEWAEQNEMEAFLSVAKGSCEPPYVLEMIYRGRGSEGDTTLVVGKGVTFDAGGINLKRCDSITDLRGDMAGAAVIVGALRLIAGLKIPVNINAVVPLCENMLSGQAMKPGDLVTTKSGKTVLLNDTDSEGRLIMADAITYGMNAYNPQVLLDVATFSYKNKSNLGSSSTAVFTNRNDMWKQLEQAGSITGDRMWRMPLWQHFTNKLSDTFLADLKNSAGHGSEDMCYAAAFLKEFAGCADIIHLDIGGSGMVSDAKEFAYYEKNHMTGRPTRTIAQFFQQLASQQSGTEDK